MHATEAIQLPFFTNLLILLVSARVLGELMERIKQPAMIGEIIAGILLGPSVFNLIHRTEDIKVISELGVFLLMILAGLEIHIDDILKSLRGRKLIIPFLAFFLPIGSGFFISRYFDQDIMTSLFIGLCFAITALPVSVRILMDLGKLNTETGRMIISVALFDDVLALSVLGILLCGKEANMSNETILHAGTASLVKLLLFITLLTIAYVFIRNFTRKGKYLEKPLNTFIDFLKGKEPLFAIFFVYVLLFSTFTEFLGLHFIIGAFFASLFINESLIGTENFKAIEKTTGNMAMGFLAPIFFAGIGLEFNVSSIQHVGLLAAVVGVSYFSKIIGGYAGGRLAGLGSKPSFAIGVGLNARGIMELVIANIAYKAGLINDEIFSILVIMGVLTTLTTPFMLKRTFA